MVELEVDDYSEILDWFILAFGPKGKDLTQLPLTTKRVFYKLNFLAEDKIKEAKLMGIDTDDVDE